MSNLIRTCKHTIDVELPWRRVTALLTSAVALAGLAACDVDQTREGEMPDIDVSMEEGRMPAYDVDWATVDVGTREKAVEVPKVVIVQETETIQVPYIDVTMPGGADDVEERTVAVELELRERSGTVDIETVLANERRLFVVSRLERDEQTLGDQRIRISDQLQLRAPDDLEVRHLIVGPQPEGSWNQQYRYVASMEEARSIAGADARELWSP